MRRTTSGHRLPLLHCKINKNKPDFPTFKKLISNLFQMLKSGAASAISLLKWPSREQISTKSKFRSKHYPLFCHSTTFLFVISTTSLSVISTTSLSVISTTSFLSFRLSAAHGEISSWRDLAPSPPIPPIPYFNLPDSRNL
jgi:hypothetical protein